ncbi:uncharacterized protein ARMOST_17410 [Armillaria ostoyae]|uniref:Uncharacterized protein n=1 Tax=Armillaria ostoyae TaxID=47428 RepID=A0A284RYX2_ARMOS|nr:uncharacterized protein ARMOST_17410 [Armillaria ostoyae]
MEDPIPLDITPFLRCAPFQNNMDAFYDVKEQEKILLCCVFSAGFFLAGESEQQAEARNYAANVNESPRNLAGRSMRDSFRLQRRAYEWVLLSSRLGGWPVGLGDRSDLDSLIQTVKQAIKTLDIVHCAAELVISAARINNTDCGFNESTLLCTILIPFHCRTGAYDRVGTGSIHGE